MDGANHFALGNMGFGTDVGVVWGSRRTKRESGPKIQSGKILVLGCRCIDDLSPIGLALGAFIDFGSGHWAPFSPQFSVD